MDLTLHEIARMLDLSAVRADTNESEVRAMAEAARRYECACVFALPSFTGLLVELLGDLPQVHVGGTVGFPSGGNTTRMKVAEAQELLALGCSELDMVLNIGMLRSGHDKNVLEDIRAVTEVAGSAPLKVILECHYLTDDEIRRACLLCIEGGAAFVKTGTGWAPTGATRHNIALITSVVGDAIGIKAAGGIRDKETLLDLYWLGARRFGVSLQPALRILGDMAAETAEVASPGY